MLKSSLQRLEALEEQERDRKEKRRLPWLALAKAAEDVILAYFVGGLTPDELVETALSRALSYASPEEANRASRRWAIASIENRQLYDQLCDDLLERYHQALRHLFAKAGLDVDRSPLPALAGALQEFVRKLPPAELDQVKAQTREYLYAIKADRKDVLQTDLTKVSKLTMASLLCWFLGFPENGRLAHLRNSRVFTQTAAMQQQR